MSEYDTRSDDTNEGKRFYLQRYTALLVKKIGPTITISQLGNRRLIITIHLMYNEADP